VAFTAVIGRALRQGNNVSCACFGAGSDEVLTAASLVRNGVLLAGAVVAFAADRPLRPGLAAMVTVSTTAIVGALGVELVRTRQRVGALWDNSSARVPW
jgi:hypothetical protein